jgi:hypothetical protein
MSGDEFGSFNTFKPFNRYAPFKPLPFFEVAQESLSSPASRGRTTEGA